jgi:uncharacterized protein (DUF1501 family)
MSEFGRAAGQNGNRGTDHGHGTAFLAFGGRSAAGRCTPTGRRSPRPAVRDRDLAVTTDFRDVFGEVCVRHLGADPAALGKVFPKHAADPAEFRGFMRA